MIKVDHSLALLSVLAVIIISNIRVLCGSEWCGDYAHTTRGLIYSRKASHINQSPRASDTFYDEFSIINGVVKDAVEYMIVSKLHINVTSGRVSALKRDTDANYDHLLRSLRKRKSRTIFTNESSKSYWSLEDFMSKPAVYGAVQDGLAVNDKDRRQMSQIKLYHGREDEVALQPWSISYTIMVLRLYYPEQEIQYSYFIRRSDDYYKAGIGTIGIAKTSVVESFKTLCSLRSFLLKKDRLPHYIIPIDEKHGVIIFSDHKYVIDEIDAAIYLTSNRSKDSRYFRYKETNIETILAIIVDAQKSGSFKLIESSSSVYKMVVEKSSESILQSVISVEKMQVDSSVTRDFIASLEYRRPVTTISDSFDYYHSTSKVTDESRGSFEPSSMQVPRMDCFFIRLYYGREERDNFDQFYNRIHSLIVPWPNGTSSQYSYHFLLRPNDETTTPQVNGSSQEDLSEWLIYFHISGEDISLNPDLNPLVTYESFKKVYPEIPIHLIPLGNDINSKGIALYSHGRYFVGNIFDILYLRPLHGYKRRIQLDFDCNTLESTENIYLAP